MPIPPEPPAASARAARPARLPAAGGPASRPPAAPSPAFRLLAACLAALTLLAAACSLAPRYERPPAPVPAILGDSGAASGAAPAEATAETLPPWRDFLPDERLRALVDLALGENRDLALARLRVREALAMYGVERSERFPMLEAEASESVSGGGGGRRTAESWDLGLAVPDFEIDYLRRVADMSAAAREDWLGAVESARFARLSLVGSVAAAYLDSRLAREALELTRRTAASWRSSMAFIERRIVSGQSELLDLEMARARVAYAEAQMAAGRLAVARADNALALLVGSFEERVLPEPTPLNSWPAAELPEGLPSSSLLSRPDIVAAEHGLIGAHADIGAARAAFFPRLSLTGALGLMSMELASLFDPGSDQWSYRPMMTLPIFSGGRNRANLELAEVRREMAVTEYEMAVQEAFKEAAEALSARRLLADRVKAQRALVAAQRRVLELASNRYQSGVISYLEVLEAQREVFEAEMTLLDLSRERIMGDLDLYFALGGGFPGEASTLGPGAPEPGDPEPGSPGTAAPDPGDAPGQAAPAPGGRPGP